MKICMMSDLHLPYKSNALQYDVLRWACEDLKKKAADAFVFAGDFTADGDRNAAHFFMNTIHDLGIPSVIIPGNSDLRTPESCNYMHQLASPAVTVIQDTAIIAVNDSDRTIEDAAFSALDQADDTAIVVMHHPVNCLKAPFAERFRTWRESHPRNPLFYGHLHMSRDCGNDHCLQAADPDKAIGESPCITYYDTCTQALEKAYYFCPVPTDFYDYLGISCFHPDADIRYAADHGLKTLELRPNAVNYDPDMLLSEIQGWRKAGGRNFSMHAPEVIYENSMAGSNEEWDRFLSLAELLHPDRLTIHVPKTSIRTINEDPAAMDRITEFLKEKLSRLSTDCVIGIENMHMTASEHPDDTRRFGYIPSQVKQFVEALKAAGLPNKIGVNFDTGHARNNPPFHQKYTLGAWYSEIGAQAVGYHIHQVLLTDGKMENHMAITDVYGKLISYASFFKAWQKGIIRKAPVICEIRGHSEAGAYEPTIDLFEALQQRKVFDLHSHTWYSNCGRDEPDALIDTAIANGISLLGITDHSYGIADRKAQYLKDIRCRAQKYEGKIQVLCGIEIPSLPDIFDIRDPSQIKDYDYCLIEHITYKDSIVGKHLFEFCDRMGILCGIAHTDLFAYCDMYHYDYREFFRELAKRNIFWEMNMSYDSIHGYKKHPYVRDFVSDPVKQQIVKEAGVYISVGFDSHRKEDYAGNYVHEMYDFLCQNGFRTADQLVLSSIKRPSCLRPSRTAPIVPCF